MSENPSTKESTTSHGKSERVALGHFHERVGESPRSYENFGTSGSKKSRFVFEIRPLENSKGSKSNFIAYFRAN